MSKKNRRRWSLSTRVLVGFALGVATGVFFGEAAASLNFIGLAWVGLLQMTVLPYIVTSLTASLGQLDPAGARELAIKGGLILLVLSGIGLALVVLYPLAFPDWESATFFSTTLVEERLSFDLLSFYIPINPFHSLANNIVPAVVVFCIALGVALMGLKDKRRIIGDLNTISDALMRMAQFVADLAPYGVFAIVASSAGTLDVSELAKIQVYVVTYMAISMVATFFILPALVSTLTSLRYRDIISSSWGPLITAFATGNLLVVLPMLSYASKRLLADIQLEEDEVATAVDVLVPASFNFPNVGKLLSLSFVLFGGWFVGSSVPLTRYAEFLFTGFFTFFGSPVAGMPFLLNMFQLPTDLTELYVAVDVIASRFGTMVAAVNVLALALLGACAMCGRLRFRTGRLLRFGAISAAAVLVTLLGIRLFFTHVVQQSYEGYRVFIEMDLSTDPAPFEVYETLPPGDPDPTLPTLERVRQRGSLRVAYLRDRLPFAFVNASDRLVGFDIEMAHLLAKQLGVSLELVRTELSQIPQSLAEGRYDLVMAGVVMTPEWSERLSFSTPYMDTALGFVVRDHRKEEFSSLEALQNLDSLRIGAQQDAPYYIDMFREHLPEAEIVLLRSPREFFREEAGELDALVYTAEAGSAWSLVYPNYSVAVPHPLVLAVPLAYPVKRGDRDMVDYLDVWIELKKKDGTIQRLHEYWIQGKEAAKKGPRWSVVRDVLHWVD